MKYFIGIILAFMCVIWYCLSVERTYLGVERNYEREATLKAAFEDSVYKTVEHYVGADKIFMKAGYSKYQADSLEAIKSTIKYEKQLLQNKKIQQYNEKRWSESKAGRIYKKHPKWSRDECIDIADNRIWIGMHYEMLVCERGQYNHLNTSNYGNGNQYQMCWDDYNTSCFYCSEDGIVTSYN